MQLATTSTATTRPSSTSIRWIAIAAMLTSSWLVGCDETSPPMDAGPLSDAAPSADAAAADAGPGDDAGTDGGLADSGPVDPCAACGAAEICLRDVCIDTCGGELTEWDDALASDLTPVSNFCRPTNARTVAIGSEGPVVYDLTTAMDGETTVYTISRWRPIAGETITPTVVATHRLDRDAAWGGAMPFAGSYLSVNADQSALLFGYTVFVTPPAPDPAVVLGELFVVDIATGAVETRDAPGDFDATWITNHAFVVSGLGLGSAADGNGLYVSERGSSTATYIASGLGPNSGAVALTDTYLLAGGAAADFSSIVYSLSRAEFDAAVSAGTTVDLATSGSAVETSAGVPLSSVFGLLSDGRITVAPWMMPLLTYDATYGATGLSLGSATTLADSIFTGALVSDDTHLLLVHSGGLLLVSQP